MYATRLFLMPADIGKIQYNLIDIFWIFPTAFAMEIPHYTIAKYLLVPVRKLSRTRYNK